MLPRWPVRLASWMPGAPTPSDARTQGARGLIGRALPRTRQRAACWRVRRRESGPDGPLGFERGPGGGARESSLEAQDRLGVELRDAGLGDAQDLADLPQGELLVVVEGHDELLALGKPRDRLPDRLLHLGLGEGALGIRRIGVLDRVDESHRIAAAGVHGPELVQGADRRA